MASVAGTLRLTGLFRSLEVVRVAKRVARVGLTCRPAGSPVAKPNSVEVPEVLHHSVAVFLRARSISFGFGARGKTALSRVCDRYKSRGTPVVLYGGASVQQGLPFKTHRATGAAASATLGVLCVNRLALP